MFKRKLRFEFITQGNNNIDQVIFGIWGFLIMFPSNSEKYKGSCQEKEVALFSDA